jgi:biotin carboxyl carrier protein
MNRILSYITQVGRAAKSLRVLPPKGSPQRLVVVISFAVFLTIVFPFSFWFLTWHGWALDPAQVESGFADPVNPGRASQQIMQIAEKLTRGDDSVRRWYPRIQALAKNPDEDLRRNVAWLMGKDASNARFREALRELLRDKAPQVRLEAALSLAEFRDADARDELKGWLSALRISSSAAGRVQMRIDVGDTTKPNTVVARIGEMDVEARVFGTVRQVLAKDGENVSPGDALVAVELPVARKEEVRRALRLLGHS